MKEILIAGGGIGGLAAALALARKGRKVRVLEKAAEFGEIGYGIQMGPNVARMLDLLGVLKTLESTSVFPEALILIIAGSWVAAFEMNPPRAHLRIHHSTGPGARGFRV